MSELTTQAKIPLTGGLDFWHTQAIAEAGLDAVMLTDGPHGVRKQVGESDHVGLNESAPATCFPPAVGLASTWNRSLLERVGVALGEECRALGVGVLLGPGINIKRSPLCGRNFEYFSEDPHLAGELAVPLVQGIQSQGVGTSLKHFAANSQETDRMRRDSQVDERTLREIYLSAFRKVVTVAQPWTVMCSYNRVNGIFASESHFLLTQVLREEWGFEGAVVSDWGAVHDRVTSLAAGLDLEMPANPEHEAKVVSALAAGRIEAGTVDRAYDRLDRLVRRAMASLADAPADFDHAAHHELAREVAGQCIVLLENDGVLPLAPSAKVAVVGEFARTPRYQGAGSSRVNPTELDNALDAITALAGSQVRFAPGFATASGQNLGKDPVADAVAVAKDADVVLAFLGLGESHESEGYDRTTMELPAEQLVLLDALLEVNPNVVVVLSNGSSVLISSFAKRVRAVVEGWLLGQGGGAAIADVLFGVVNPSGKLAETIPLRSEDVPSHLHFPGDRSGVRYGEGLFVGYRGYDAGRVEVAYPFGYGLSYTSFGYADLVVGQDGADLVVRLTLTNTGERAGREVVQAYVGLPDSTVVRACRELKGFADVTLAPGASATVSIPIPVDDLAYYSVPDQAWLVEGGRYLVEVGGSSRDLPLSAGIDLAGNEPVRPLQLLSTMGEAMRVPAFAAVVKPMADAMLGGDEEMMRMMADMPLSALVGFTGQSTAEFQQLLDQVNAAR